MSYILTILVVLLGFFSQLSGCLNSAWFLNGATTDWSTVCRHSVLQDNAVTASPYFLLTSGAISPDGHKVGPALGQILRFCPAIISSDSGPIIANNIHGWPLWKIAYIGFVQAAYIGYVKVTVYSPPLVFQDVLVVSLDIQLHNLSGMPIMSKLHYGMVRSPDFVGRVDSVPL